MKTQCFIFSWKGQYENTLKLENHLSKFLDVTVINSDDDNKNDHWVNIGDECYFSKQFKTALELFDSTKYEFFFHIQADASYDDWNSILKSAKTSFRKYNWGVFAPNVDDTFYISERTDVFALEDTLKVVATTDNTCWFVHKDIIEAMKENVHFMDENELGWGWDLLICAFSHLNKRKVIRDYSMTVDHPKSTGYKKEQAEMEMSIMFEKTSNELKQMIYLIKAHPILIAKYYGIENNMFVYDTGM